jgi:hypothetical protein
VPNRPDSTQLVAVSWWSLLCAPLRTSATLSITFAIRESFSPTRSPGTAEGMVPYLPRTSSGASGLGSNVSWCDSPPPRNTSTTDFARAPADGPFAAAFGPQHGRERQPGQRPDAEEVAPRVGGAGGTRGVRLAGQRDVDHRSGSGGSVDAG